MRSRPPSRPFGAHPRPRARAHVVALLGALALAGGCGGKDAPPAPPDTGPAPPSATDGPLATYRLAAMRIPGGDSLTIEALAPCRAQLEVGQGAAHDGARWRDLDPGDSLRIVWALVADDDPPPSPTGAAAPAGPGKRVRYRLRYGFDEQDTRESLLRLDARGPSPWVRTALATVPVSARPFPNAGLALATLAVADVTSTTGLALVAGPVPTITGAPAGTPDDHLQLATLWLRLSPR